MSSHLMRRLTSADLMLKDLDNAYEILDHLLKVDPGTMLAVKDGSSWRLLPTLS